MSAEGSVPWKNNIFLPKGFNAETVVHELAHVLDNNVKSGITILPATWNGRGASDAMVEGLGGHPERCNPRFMCLNPEKYAKEIAGLYAWPAVNPIANNGVADDFAETFAKAVYNPSEVPYGRLMWMNTWISILIGYLP